MQTCSLRGEELALEPHPDCIEQKIRGLSAWVEPISSIEPLMGGISNESWLVSDGAGQHVVRFGQDYPFHHVLRDRELMTARAAHQAGFAPEIKAAGSGFMVSVFLNAKTYEANDIKQQIPRVAALVRSFHKTMPQHIAGPAFMFWVFHVIRDYARTLEAGASSYTPTLGHYLNIADALEKVQVPLPIILGHNDLLPANILDDGNRLWLIDFEYAGFSTAMFDLAGLASNAEMTAEESHELLHLYFDAPPTPELKRSHAAMQCASLLREAMWSMTSELYLNAPGVDYAAYTQENLERLTRALDQYYLHYGKTC